MTSSRHIALPDDTPLRIGSLFSGIDGLGLGLERATGGRVLWQVEKEPYCRAVLAKHWPQAERFDDVCTVGAHNLARVDILCGGFPCQDISLAGKGAGLAGERSGLWREYARLVRELRPRFVVVENVSALLARGLGDVLGGLSACGYDAIWDCIPAAAVGAPHRRDRLFIVAWLADARGDRREGCAEPDERTEQPKQQASLGNDPDGRNPVGIDELADANFTGPQGHGRPVEVECAPRSSAGSAASRRAGGGRGNGPAESGMGRAADGLSDRLDGAFGRALARVRAQPREWPARPGEAQRTWEPSRTQAGVRNRAARLKAIGNAVSPVVGEVIGHVVNEVRAQFEERIPQMVAA
jgi:DNA (cytosine-5)-methyltransferase 1